MVKFRESLSDILLRTGWTQIELARRCNVNAGNLSRWCQGKTLPDRNALAKLVEGVPKEDAGRLVIAWIEDMLPPEASDLVSVSLRHASARLQEAPVDEWPSGISARTRRKFIDFSQLAMMNPDVMDIVEVLHSAAMRMRKP